MSSSLYFFILYPRKKREIPNDINFVELENNNKIPKCIFIEENYENQIYYYKKIFKVDKSTGKGKKANNYYFEFEIGDDKYIISFDSKGFLFVYDVVVEMGKKIIDVRRKINQNNIEYNDKMEYFMEALKKNGEESKIDELYKETIELYSKKKGFNFLIELFLKIYQKKNLCTILLEKFKEMNKNHKDNQKNMDRKSYLKKYISEFNTIKCQADKLIDNNNYNTIEFYGILLSYFNFYDYKNFTSIVNELYGKKPNDLYEILLIYNSHFKYPINQNLSFLNNFIKYVISNKEFSVLESGLNYIKDIDTFINVIEKNKEEIFNKYIKSDNSTINIKCIIKIDNNLKIKSFEKENETEIVEGNKTKTIVENNRHEVENDISRKNIQVIQNENKKENNSDSVNESKNEIDSNIQKKEKKSIFQIIENIKSIIEFSKKNKTFLVYFTNNFWRYILNNYKIPKQDNIEICFKLREIFIKYYNLVIDVFKEKDKKFTIKNDAINYFERDEFAFLLDQIIKKYLNIQKDLNSIEKLAYISQFNPYYQEPINYNKIDSEIFDFFDLNDVDNDFIEDFRKMDFENIFKENITEYINKMISKITNISNFDTIIKLINIKNIKDKNEFLNSLNKKYDTIIINSEKENTDENLNKTIKVVAKLAIINFIYETGKRLDFIKYRIKKLDKNIITLIFIEIMKICMSKEDKENKKDEEMKEDNISDDEENEDKENKIIEEEYKDINFKEIKEFIFEEFANNLDNENDIDYIINLIDCLEGKPEYEQKNKEKEKDNKEVIKQEDKKKKKKRRYYK